MGLIGTQENTFVGAFFNEKNLQESLKTILEYIFLC